MRPPEPTDSIALLANRRNNAQRQELRLERWSSVRDALWLLIDPLLKAGARVAIVGGGSCDDVPLSRIAERAALVDLIDFDVSSTNRGRARLGVEARDRVTSIECDVTNGSADLVLRAVRDKSPPPEALPLRTDALGSGDYDLVVGDMIYTQLLHAGLIALHVTGKRQHALMRRYDGHLTRALVQRLEASVCRGGYTVHLHDLACWAEGHTQPMTIDQVMAAPCSNWNRLLRHDYCDPHLALGELGVEILDSAWWRWPFEPNKQFVVRATVTRTAS